MKQSPVKKPKYRRYAQQMASIETVMARALTFEGDKLVMQTRKLGKDLYELRKAPMSMVRSIRAPIEGDRNLGLFMVSLDYYSAQHTSGEITALEVPSNLPGFRKFKRKHDGQTFFMREDICVDVSAAQEV